PLLVRGPLMIPDDYEPGRCMLCNTPLGLLRGLTRVPIFEPTEEPARSLAQFIKWPLHRDCWELWEYRDYIAELAVCTKAGEFSGARILAWGLHVGAWGHASDDIHFAHGSIFLPRSSMYFNRLFGVDVEACEIRARTPNLQQI